MVFESCVATLLHANSASWEIASTFASLEGKQKSELQREGWETRLIGRLGERRFKSKIQTTSQKNPPYKWHPNLRQFSDFVDSMFHLELGVDFDRGFSSGFSPPDYFRHFSVFGQAHRVPESVPKSVFSLRETQEEKSATKSVAKSVLLGRKIHRKIRHSHQENPPPIPLSWDVRPRFWASNTWKRGVTATCKQLRAGGEC